MPSIHVLPVNTTLAASRGTASKTSVFSVSDDRKSNAALSARENGPTSSESGLLTHSPTSAASMPIHGMSLERGNDAVSAVLDALRSESFSLWATGPLEATSPQGTFVSVSRLPLPNDGGPLYAMQLTRPDGSQFHLDFRDNMRIHEATDGIMALYLSAKGTTRIYEPDGTVTEAKGNTLNRNADQIIINTTGQRIDTGDGDNLILNFADGALILCGAGNDTIVLADGIRSNRIRSNGGNDTVTGLAVFDTTLALGNGDNTVRAYSFRGGDISAGDGNNSFAFQLLRDIGLSLGKGNNTFSVRQAGSGTRLEAGDGNNIASIAVMEGNATLKLGDGQNRLFLTSLLQNASARLGAGNNNVRVHEMADNALLSLGNGDNQVRIDILRDAARVSPPLAGMALGTDFPALPFSADVPSEMGFDFSFSRFGSGVLTEQVLNRLV